MQPKDIYKNSKKVAEFVKLLSNNTRLIVLCSLIEGPKCVTDLVNIAKISQSALSQHLAKMSQYNMIQGKREGNQIIYSISDPRIDKVMKTFHEIFCNNNHD